MPSPFLGMDPYLAGYLWPDVHHRLATQISDQLMPQLRPRYVARIEISAPAWPTPPRAPAYTTERVSYYPHPRHRPLCRYLVYRPA